METKCSLENCENLVFKSLTKCALHCEKNDYSADRRSGLLSEFYRLFLEYLSEEINSHSIYKTISFSHEEYEGFCNKTLEHATELENRISEELRTFGIVITKVVFPTYDDRDPFSYLDLLIPFKSIHFNYCDFYCRSLPLDKTQVFFQDCNFYKSWSLYDYRQLKNIDNVNYQTCTFYGEVNAYAPDTKRAKLSMNQFNFDCKFKSKLALEKVDIEGELFSSNQIADNYKLFIKRLDVRNARLNGKFTASYLEAEENKRTESVNFEDVEFNSKFELKCSKIKSVEIKNCNFAAVSDFYETEFGCFQIKKSIFHKFVGFERCCFGVNTEPNSDGLARFEHTTFFDFASFRGGSYKDGLQLSEANFKSPPNFYEAQINGRNTNRETYRIIKHSFDSVGNHIEANRFFAFEMETYRRELKAQKGSWKEWLLLSFNSLISDHGQNYMKAVIWWSATVASIGFVIVNDSRQWLVTYFDSLPSWWLFIRDALNTVALGFLPFNPIIKGREHLALFILLFGLLLAGITWHVLVAVRRHSKR